MIDSHCHLADEAFVDDLDAVIARAREAGVRDAVCILAANDAAENDRAVRVRELWPEIRVATGVHPHAAGEYAGRAGDAAAATRANADRWQASAIGEIGLDYHYDFAPPAAQHEVFAAQVALAVELNRPVVIHTREATDDTFAILREAGGAGLRGVFHCFTGDAAMASRAVAIGFYVSLAGILTFPRADSLRDAARVVPPERLLIETDSPYLAPVPHRGVRNEPAFVGRVLDTLAGLHGMERDALEAVLAGNFATLFGSHIL